MAYVLGFIYADGTLIDDKISRGRYLAITSVDEDIILRIKSWLGSQHKIGKEPPIWSGGKDRFRIRIGNAVLYKALEKIGLYPNKSLTIIMPAMPEPFFKDFLRGYFDGDGCVHFERAKGKKKKMIIKRLSVIFTSGSRIFLEQIGSLLEARLGIKGHIYQSQRAFQLRFFTADSIQIFKFMYYDVASDGFFMRKYVIFEEYFALCKKKLDQDICGILQAIQGHVAN